MEAPRWNIESEYSSLQAKSFKDDWSFVEDSIQIVQEGVSRIQDHLKSDPTSVLSQVQELLLQIEKSTTLARNIRSYLSCLSSVDASNKEAAQKSSEFETLQSQSAQVRIPLDFFLKTCDEAVFRKVLEHSELKDFEFIWFEMRKQAPFLLSESEESIIESLSVTGHNSWGNLYNDLSGKLKCHLEYPEKVETVGLAQAHSLLRGHDEFTRKVAWQAIQNTWQEHRESSAAILNSQAGWRLELYKKRSHAQNLHFLDMPLMQNRISRETLDALITACRENVADSRKAVTLMAQTLKKTQLDPWDLLAPCPISTSKTATPFAQATSMIQNAFAEISPEMGNFVDHMVKNRWIEGRVLSTKRTGAYCTGFEKSREPRVFMTYMGSNSDISTLAHEIGHAFHSWTMKDMPSAQTHYPMTLAETASIFSETILHDSLIKNARTREEKISYAWNDIEGASAMLLNIPARFEFEKEFYERRQKRKVSADELEEIMDQSWSHWYGPTLSQNDRLYWAHKLHFSMTKLTFYNFPYTFGYLFSLSIYARKQKLGSNFMKVYTDILRDTGRMSAEDLIQKHLGEDIREPKFWQNSIDYVKNQIRNFETLL